MSSPVYRGGLVADPWRAAVQQRQEAAEARNAQAGVAECGHTVDETGEVVLDGQSPIAAGSPTGGTRVPNLVIEHMVTPVTKRSLPSRLTTSPLTAASPSVGAAARDKRRHGLTTGNRTC